MNDQTVRAYDLDAVAYAEASSVVPDSVRAEIEDFVDRLPAGARVLEELGLVVRPTDGWADVDARSGIAGTKLQESWLELSAVRGTVTP
jgi:hypothetical protein